MSKKDNTRQPQSERKTERQQRAAPAHAPAGARAGAAGPSWRRWLIVGLSALVLLYILNILAGAIPAPWDRDNRTMASAPSGGEIRAAESKPVTSVQANPAGEIRLSSGSMAEGTVQFYEYADPSGSRIRFFAAKDAQGAVRTALDNCQECFHAHKGYTQRGQEMVCGECGKGFPIAYLGEAAGDCHPIDLPSIRAGEEVVIKVADLVASNASGASGTAAAGSSASTPAARAVPNSTGEIRIALAALADGKALFYEYANPFGGRIRFFAVRDTQGTLHAALDNCQECFQARRGYIQRGPEMVCRNCGKGFPIASINGAASGCSPIGLPFTTTGAGDELVVKAADLVALDAGHR